mgnify:CR=1 FL=1
MLQLQYMHKYHEKRITTYSPLSELNTQRFRCPEFDTIDWKTSYAMIGCSHVFGEANDIENTIPYILTELTGTYCVNLGTSGSSRELTFFNAMNVLQQTDVKKVIIIWTYPRRIDTYTHEGYITSNKRIEMKASISPEKKRLFTKLQEMKLNRLQNRTLDTLYDDVHFDNITKQYVDILTRAYADRILLFNIKDLEQEFGGHIGGDNKHIPFDLAKDNRHFGPIWNRKVANKIKDKLND